MSVTFKLPCPIPSGKNAVKITRTGQRYPDQRFKVWREEALLAVSTQVKKWPKFTKPVTMIVDYVPADLRRRDLPGMADALCHLLEKAGIVADDCLIHQLIWNTYPMDTDDAGCTVTIQLPTPRTIDGR